MCLCVAVNHNWETWMSVKGFASWCDQKSSFVGHGTFKGLDLEGWIWDLLQLIALGWEQWRIYLKSALDCKLDWLVFLVVSSRIVSRVNDRGGCLPILCHSLKPPLLYRLASFLDGGGGGAASFCETIVQGHRGISSLFQPSLKNHKNFLTVPSKCYSVLHCLLNRHTPFSNYSLAKQQVYLTWLSIISLPP